MKLQPLLVYIVAHRQMGGLSSNVNNFICHFIYIYIYIYTYICNYINSETLVEKLFKSAQHFSSGNYYKVKVVPVFRSVSSLYCYRPVSYGQEMTTLIRQNSLILPDECSHLLTIRNRPVAIK